MQAKRPLVHMGLAWACRVPPGGEGEAFLKPPTRGWCSSAVEAQCKAGLTPWLAGVSPHSNPLFPSGFRPFGGWDLKGTFSALLGRKTRASLPLKPVLELFALCGALLLYSAMLPSRAGCSCGCLQASWACESRSWLGPSGGILSRFLSSWRKGPSCMLWQFAHTLCRRVHHPKGCGRAAWWVYLLKRAPACSKVPASAVGRCPCPGFKRREARRPRSPASK